ncbi:MAG: sigma-70 family RNA polymerase sigma factor [Longicatena sp.]
MKSETQLQNAIELHGNMIRKLCFLHLKQKADVDDIFQDVFLKYYQSDFEFNSSEHEKAWLIRVTINACKDNLTSWFHRKVELKDDLQALHIEAPKEDNALLESILKLPKKYKNVIYLYYYEGYKTKEIANILEVKENTVSTWMRRAKDELKGMLGGDYLEE